jgi:hypothetical protein
MPKLRAGQGLWLYRPAGLSAVSCLAECRRCRSSAATPRGGSPRPCSGLRFRAPVGVGWAASLPRQPTKEDRKVNVNSYICTGRLTKDPELRSLPSGTSVCQLRLAVDNVARGREVGFINVSVYGSAGEAAAKYLSKGLAGGGRRPPGVRRWHPPPRLPGGRQRRVPVRPPGDPTRGAGAGRTGEEPSQESGACGGLIANVARASAARATPSEKDGNELERPSDSALVVAHVKTGERSRSRSAPMEQRSPSRPRGAEAPRRPSEHPGRSRTATRCPTTSPISWPSSVRCLRRVALSRPSRSSPLVRYAPCAGRRTDLQWFSKGLAK